MYFWLIRGVVKTFKRGKEGFTGDDVGWGGALSIDSSTIWMDGVGASSNYQLSIDSSIIWRDGVGAGSKYQLSIDSSTIWRGGWELAQSISSP